MRELRRGRGLPVLLLTARDAKDDIVRGLDAGACDYLTKPFSFEKLRARVRALARRGVSARDDRLRYDDIELDVRRRTAVRSGRDLNLALVLAHRGSITVTTSERGGARFRVRLPAISTRALEVVRAPVVSHS